MSKLSKKLARLDPLHKMAVELDLDRANTKIRALREELRIAKEKCARRKEKYGIVESLYHDLIDKVMGKNP